MKRTTRLAGVAVLSLLVPSCGIGGAGILNPTAAPGIPTAVSAKVGNRSVTLSWTSSVEGASYTVQRALSPAGPFVPVSQGQPFLTPTSFRDSGLTDGVTYFYEITASNQFGTSEPSGAISVVPGFKATSVSAGVAFGMALLADQTVWAWGDNSFGQIPNPQSSPTNNSPLQVTGLEGVVSIAGGEWTALALLGDGSVWEWGGGAGSPVQVQNLADVRALAAGGATGAYNFASTRSGVSFGLALKVDGTVWSWGTNAAGQLGIGSITPDVPSGIGNPIGGSAVQALTPPGIVAIAAGEFFALALSQDGTVWAWGDNSQGQLGNGATSSTPVSTPAQVSNLTDVTAISAGANHCLALRSDGSVWAWGQNSAGQLGNGSTSASPVTVPVRVLMPPGAAVTSVSAGEVHSLALRSDGSVWSWGDNSVGQLGTGSASPTPVTTPVQVHELTQATAIAAGAESSLAILGGGSVCAWGGNSQGELGTGQGQTFSVPSQVMNLTGAAAISCGGVFSLALRQTGEIDGWGENNVGELGLGTTALNTPVPVPVTSPGATFTQISAGPAFGLAIDPAGAVWSWGDNFQGQLGNGSSGPTPVSTPGKVGLPSGSVFTAAAAGWTFGMALRSDGTVWAWGDNTSGQLGNGSTSGTPVTTPVPVALPAGSVFTAIAAGSQFGMALRSDGTVWAWGRNADGELGTGSATAPVTTPVQVAFPGGTVITALSTGGGTYSATGIPGHAITFGEFALALRSDGTVWGWGADPFGNLGDGSTWAGGSGPGSVPLPLQAGLPAGSTFTAISAGNFFGLALRSDGTVWGWGKNTVGALGASTDVIALGGNTPGRLTPGQVNTLSGVTAISTGGSSVLLLMPDHMVFGQGDNSQDQLGTAFLAFSALPVVITH